VATDHSERLKAIRTFPSLVKYLRKELDWPIDADRFEDMTFDYSPEELGIDAKAAAKIMEIKRLRPLSATQPWGIFFIKFEPKRLPVVALRRILNRVALKKRASANSADRAAWQTDDLLFISNYGEGNERQISFAHFSENIEKQDLPTLRVLGWDNLDTSLHLDHVADELQSKLAWPEDDTDIEHWRRQWRSAFTLEHRQVINTSRDLAIRLAELARTIRDRINTVLDIETDKGHVTTLMKAFQEALIHDLDADGFADMYAQTIAYGLLSARVEHPEGKTASDFAAQMPVTIPFLKELVEEFFNVERLKIKSNGGPGIDFDELGVSEVVELLDSANMEAVVRDFGDRNPLEDPVIHFYELFLKEYDAEKRMQRGVFYTPRPVVSFIVRSVDELLRTEFGLEDGLADTTTWRELTQRFDDFEIPKGATPDHAFVQILDPATGTGTFLVEVIDLIHKTMMDKWQAEGHGAKKLEQLWNEYVPEHLLARLYGYELLMAPYAIAHMKIGLKLSETGYRFESDACARIYLTNALEPAKPFQMSFDIPALAHEAESVNALKRDHQFTVVIGNPPYAATSSNLTPELRSIVDRYRAVKGIPIRERSMLQFEKNIQDDYIKFFALTQALLEQSPFAVGGYISNHSFLDGPTLRGVRWGLLSTFNVASFIDLHGNANKKEKPPTGGPDANVFDIRQGVAVSILCRNLVKSRETVQHLDLWGTRDRKYDFLGSRTASTAGCAAITVEPPNYFIVNQKDGAEIKGWQEYVEIIDVFTKRSTGTETGFDNLLVAFDRSELEQNLARFCSSSRSDREVQDDWGIDGGHAGELLEKRSGLQDDIGQHIRSFQLRAFDFRKALLQKELLKTNSFNVMLDLGEGSPGLVTTRQTKERFSVLVVEGFTGHKCTSSYDRSYVFPLFTKSNGDLLHGKRTYLSQNILRHFGKLAESENEGLDELTLSIEVFHTFTPSLARPAMPLALEAA
jgi:hypothetical protein